MTRRSVECRQSPLKPLVHGSSEAFAVQAFHDGGDKAPEHLVYTYEWMQYSRGIYDLMVSESVF